MGWIEGALARWERGTGYRHGGGSRKYYQGLSSGLKAEGCHDFKQEEQPATAGPLAGYD